MRQTRTKYHQPNTFSTADVDDDDDNSDDNGNNQPTATMPARTAAAAAAASMTRTCTLVLVTTATRSEWCLTRRNAASRVAPDQNSRCAVQREEQLDQWLSQLMKIKARVRKYTSTKRGKQLWLGIALHWCCVCQVRFGTMIFVAWFRSIGTENYWPSCMSTNILNSGNPHLTSPSEQCLDNKCCLSSWRHLCYGRGQSDLIQLVRSNGWEHRNPSLALRYCFEKPNPSCCSQDTEFRYWPSNSLLFY